MIGRHVTIHIMEMAVQMNGAQMVKEDQPSHANQGWLTMVMVKVRKMVLSIISKHQLLAQAEILLIKTQMFLILSVLLDGNYLTVSRVGIIIIRLNHGSIFLKGMASSMARQALTI